MPQAIKLIDAEAVRVSTSRSLRGGKVVDSQGFMVDRENE
jgi:hypothetical protein